MLMASFLIWNGTEEKSNNFFNKINKKHIFIKLDQNYSKLEIEFLNLLVYKYEPQELKTPFKEKRDLHAKSDLPALFKKVSI